MRDFLSISDLNRQEAYQALDLAATLKKEWKDALAAGRRAPARLEGRTLAMIFEKPSLRTRLSFEAGMFQLGGYGVNLQAGEVGRLGERESISDVARNLERWCQIIQARVFSHESVVELAKWAQVPVINGLSDFEHPTQIMADYLTIREKLGSFDGLELAWVGDGNNVSHSLMLMAAMMEHKMKLAIPAGYDPDPRIWEMALKINPNAKELIEIVRDPKEAVKNAHVLYTDVWVSMGQEEEKAKRMAAFEGYCINDELLSHAPEKAFVLHDMPAKRGLEISDSVLDGDRCFAFDQAENRMHTIKAMLCYCSGITS